LTIYPPADRFTLSTLRNNDVQIQYDTICYICSALKSCTKTEKNNGKKLTI